MAPGRSKGSRSQARRTTFAYLAAVAIVFEGEFATGYESSPISTADDLYSYGCSYVAKGDGRCDSSNNSYLCDYDGGDCCACTCDEDATYGCGYGFDCQDPSAACYGSSVTHSRTKHRKVPTAVLSVESTDAHSTTKTPDGNPKRLKVSRADVPAGDDASECDDISDGWCDVSSNIAGCDYDGGDCCACTCDETSIYTCGTAGFDCRDPSASCYGSSVKRVLHKNSTAGRGKFWKKSSRRTLRWSLLADDDISDTYYYETVSEDVDDTADLDLDDDTGETTNKTDDVSTVSDMDSEYPSCTAGNVYFIGNGDCNAINNIVACGYDGGDCCSCTCKDPTNGGVCDTTYDCQDLDASCYNSNAASLESSSSSSSFSDETLYIVVGAGICGIMIIAILILWCFCARKKRNADPPIPSANVIETQHSTAIESASGSAVDPPLGIYTPSAPPAYEEPPEYDAMVAFGGNGPNNSG